MLGQVFWANIVGRLSANVVDATSIMETKNIIRNFRKLYFSDSPGQNYPVINISVAGRLYKFEIFTT